MSSLPEKLKRRGVIRIALAYLAIAWLILQALDVIGDIVPFPQWLPQITLIALVVCFPVALVLAWLYDLTPQGIREADPSGDEVSAPGIGGRRIDFVIIGALCIVIVLLVLKDSLVPPEVDTDGVLPVVGDYQRVTESPVIFPPFPSPYPLVSSKSRLYFSDFETGRMSVKQVAMSGGEVEPVDMPEHGEMEIFRPTAGLPDGSAMLVMSFSQDSTKAKVWQFPYVGGSPQFIGYGADAVPSPDGSQIAHTDWDANILIADADMSESRIVVPTHSGRVHWIRWSPDGATLRYSTMTYPRAIWTKDIASGETRQLLPDWADVQHCCGVWTPDGRYFVFQAKQGLRTQLYALVESESDIAVEPTPITIGPLDFRRPTIAPDGKSVFAIGWQLRGEAVALDATTGQMRPLVASEDLSAEWIHYAADADKMTYLSYPEGNVWISRSDGSERLQLTFDDFTGGGPRVSPDGKFVVFDGQRGDGRYSTYLVSGNGGKPQQIGPKGIFTNSGGWSPDSKKFLFRVSGTDAIQVYDVENNTATMLPKSAGMHNPYWSPSGETIFAFRRDWLTLYDVNSAETRPLLTNRPIEYAYWGKDDSTIYVIDLHTMGADRGVYAVDTETGEEVQILTFGSRRLAWGQWGMWAGVTPDGEPMFLRDLSIHHIYRLDWLP